MADYHAGGAGERVVFYVKKREAEAEAEPEPEAFVILPLGNNNKGTVASSKFYGAKERTYSCRTMGGPIGRIL